MANPDLYPNLSDKAVRRYFEEQALPNYYPNHGSAIYDTPPPGP